MTLCDRKGAIYAGRSDGMNWIKEEMAQVTNPEKRTGTLADVLAGADVFIGVSAPDAVTPEMVQTMNAGRRHLRLRQPHAGDLPRRRQGRRGGGGGHRPQRLSQPDQQRAGLPRHLPGRT